LISEIYAFFRYHTHDKEYEVIASLTEVEHHKFLRHLPTRWLECLQVIERLVEQFPALLVFFDEFVRKNPNHSKAKHIKEKLGNPFTLCLLQFLSHALKQLNSFENTFQTDGNHIHVLWANMNALLHKWLLNFVEQANIKSKKPAFTNYQEHVLPDAQLLIGDAARGSVSQLQHDERVVFYDQVREFFLSATEQIIHYLPFDNVLLRNLQFLQPLSKSSAKLEKWAVHVAKAMPTIVSSDELDILRLEIRHYKSETKIIVDDTLPVNKYWQGALELIDCPVLTRLVRASLILPHGNAEVERLFSMLGDILVKKRQNLDQRSIRSLTFIKSDMKCRGASCFDFPVTTSLLTRASKAKQTYKQRLKEEEKKRAREIEQERLKHQRALLEEERGRSSKLMEINQSISAIDAKVAASKESLKLARDLEEKAKKLKEDALAMQRLELQKKNNMLQKQQRYVRVY